MPLSKEYNMIVKSWELHLRLIYRPTISYSLHPMYHSCFATWHFGSHRSWSRVLGLAHLRENNLAPWISPSNCQHQEWGMLSGLVALVIIYMLLQQILYNQYIIIIYIRIYYLIWLLSNALRVIPFHCLHLPFQQNLHGHDMFMTSWHK